MIYFDTKHPHPEYLKKAVPLLEENLKKYPEHKNGLYHLGLASINLQYLNYKKTVEVKNEPAELKEIDLEKTRALFYEAAPFSKTRATERVVAELLASGYQPLRNRAIRD